MSRRAVRLVIEGRVQGVGYRWWAVRQASRLGLDGWVRNRADGSVELLAIGEQPKLAQLEQSCWDGPSSARVTSVDRKDAEDDGSSGFSDRPTA